MTAGTIRTGRGSAGALAGLLAVGGILLALLAFVMTSQNVSLTQSVQPAVAHEGVTVYELKPLHPHAQKHAESQVVWSWLSANDTRFCRYECKGRTYYACNMDGRWVFAVEDAAYTVTAFFTTRDYAIGHTRDNPGCHQYMSGAHP